MEQDLPLDLSTSKSQKNFHQNYHYVENSLNLNQYKKYSLLPNDTLNGSIKNIFDYHVYQTSTFCNKTEEKIPKRGVKRTLLSCDICRKCFDRPSLLKRHTRTHTGEKPHICPVCNKGFSTSSSLNTHRRIHTGEKPHKCGKCGKCFTASSNLYYHKMTHTKNKPHKCPLCPKSFPTPGDLRAHSPAHTGAWPHKCPKCSKGFSKQAGLRAHLLLHSGEKPFSCSYCERQFTQSCNLKAHVKTHHLAPEEVNKQTVEHYIKQLSPVTTSGIESFPIDESTRNISQDIKIRCDNTDLLIRNNINKNIFTNFWVQFGLQPKTLTHL